MPNKKGTTNIQNSTALIPEKSLGKKKGVEEVEGANKIKKTTEIPISIDAIKSQLIHREESKRSEKKKKKEIKNNRFTDEELKKTWDSFVKIRRENGGMQEIALLEHKFNRENNKIFLQIHNSILEVTFNKIKVELFAYLRENLQNEFISVELEKLNSESKKNIYTNREKFEHLTSKHPIIRVLQEKLMLETN